MDPFASGAVALGTAALGYSNSKTQGQWNRRLIRSENEKAREHSIGLTKLGNELDMANQKEMFDYRISQGLEAGMTPFEMFMGPAAGAGGGTTGSGNTLGSQPAKLAQNTVQAANAQLQAQTATRNQMIQAAAQLGTAKIQAESQQKVAATQAGASIGAAGISADASQYKAELEYKIRHKELVLNNKRFEKVDLPQAAANIGKTEQETAKLINDTATSAPEFVKMLKRLQMGPQNVLVEYAISNYGFNPLDEKSVSNATNQQKRNFLGLVLGSQSHAVRELFGASLAAGTGIGSARDTLGNAYESYMNKFGFDKKGNWMND